MKYKAVIFDMDGVIFNTEQIARYAWYSVAKQLGVVMNEQLWARCLGMNKYDEEKEFHKEYGEDFNYDHFINLVTFTKHREYTKVSLIKPGVEDILQSLQKSGYQIALASSSHLETIHNLLEKYHILTYFDVITSGDSIKHSKPHPEIYLNTLRMLGCNPREAIVIEDAPNGVQASMDAGIDTIFIKDTVDMDAIDSQCPQLIFYQDLSKVQKLVQEE